MAVVLNFHGHEVVNDQDCFFSTTTATGAHAEREVLAIRLQPQCCMQNPSL